MEDLNNIIQILAAAVKGLRLYDINHPATIKQIEILQNGLFVQLQRNQIMKMGLLEGTLFIDDHLFIKESPAAKELASVLESLDLAGFEFMSGLSAQEIQTLLHLIHTSETKGQDFSNVLKSHGVKRIQAIAALEDSDNLKPQKVYRKALSVVDQIFQDVRMGEIPSCKDAIKVVKDMAQLTMNKPHAMLALSMLKDYDNYTFTHSVNVSVISLAVGRACRISEEQLRTLGLGGLLHDLGKLRVDVNIITKPGRLNDSEFEAIQKHPVFGAEIIKDMDEITPEVIQIVQGHHLRFDRKGYPRSAADDDISPLVDMAAIADSYDAMTTLRSYQIPYTPRRAIARIKEISGTRLHPEYVSCFVDSLGPYPVGSLVRLDSNEVGLVTKVEPQNTALVDIKMLYDSSGILLEEPFEMQLHPTHPRRIIAEVDPQTKGIDVTDFFDLDF